MKDKRMFLENYFLKDESFSQLLQTNLHRKISFEDHYLNEVKKTKASQNSTFFFSSFHKFLKIESLEKKISTTVHLFQTKQLRFLNGFRTYQRDSGIFCDCINCMRGDIF